MHSIKIIEDFFALTDSGALFAGGDPSRLGRIRCETARALERVLVWERPELEAERGIMWPYAGLETRSAVFENLVNCGNADLRREALLFLAFLPFPKQWWWLLQAEKSYPDEPEMKAFLFSERNEIKRKIRDKPQKHFKLRHFCQVLKSWRGPEEKGVLRIFSVPYLFADAKRMLIPQISDRYLLYVEPPMGALFRHRWHRSFLLARDPVLFGVGSEEDTRFVRSQPHAEATCLAHGDFLEDISWNDPGEPREYDIVFNSTYDDMPRKRHSLMLGLMHHPRLRHTKVLMLGKGRPENVSQLKGEVERLGLEKRATVLANLRRADVPAELNRCRTGVHLSLYENGCRGIYEFFRSDLPCVISSSMAGMNADIINPRTGMAAPDRDLPDAIARVLSHRESFEPRQWFLSESGSSNSSRRLNEILKKFSERYGYEWSTDIVSLGSSGASRYVSADDLNRFKGDFSWLLGCLNASGVDDFTFSAD